ncbi:hypothetical protein WMY93_026430 [Mugilogobius chulae]|uniref:Ig-like domain-containing protein n=1 Tax=Mugilogobius chulae TaxID=88201 RepID=A0AAW0MZ14_9GOBI
MWWSFLCVPCVLCVTPIRCVVHGSCPRKEPPPGVLVVSPDIVSPTFPAAVTHSTVNSISHNAVLPKHMETQRKIILPFPRPSGAGGDVDGFEDEFDDEEKNERDVKLRIQWKFNSKNLEMSALGSTLTLSHLRMSDSGRYSCHLGGIEKFSMKIMVTEAAETPHLSCYKKSPSSKIRCEWTPQTHVHKGTSCSLFIRKSLAGEFVDVPCSYSMRRSKCWCALDHKEEDKRKLHQAYLCVSSITSNSTSELYSFTPMHILKPDPPYNVTVEPQEGLNRTLVVTWRPPYTWKFQDRFYELVYELRYKPLLSAHFQTNAISEQASRHTITMQSRESLWTQLEGTSQEEVPIYDNILTTPFSSQYFDGSGSGDYPEDLPPLPDVSLHFLWIALLFGFCLILLAVYLIRYKNRAEQQENLKQFRLKTRIDNENYLSSHPEVELLIGDFLRDVLLQRPVDIRNFAAEHFSNPNLQSNTISKLDKTENAE